MKHNFETIKLKLRAYNTERATLQDIFDEIENVEKELREKLNREKFKEKGYCPVWDNAYDYAIKEVLG